MIDMYNFFQMIPHHLILTEQYGHWSQCLVEVGWFLAFSRKLQKISDAEDNFFGIIFS